MTPDHELLPLWKVTQDAIDASEEHAERGTLDILQRALDECVALCEPFTSDAIWGQVDSETRAACEGRVLGALLRKASKAGRIKKVGYQASTDRASHGRPKQLWIGVGV